jgi:hypothetical protein
LSKNSACQPKAKECGQIIKKIFKNLVIFSKSLTMFLNVRTHATLTTCAPPLGKKEREQA